MFNAIVSIGEHATLWMEDEADAFASCDDIESCKEGFVCLGSYTLGSGHHLAEDVALQGGFIGGTFEECDDG